MPSSLNGNTDSRAPFVVAQTDSRSSQSDSLFSVGSGGLFDRSESSSSNTSDKALSLPPSPADSTSGGSSSSAPLPSSSAPSSSFSTSSSSTSGDLAGSSGGSSGGSAPANLGGNSSPSTAATALGGSSTAATTGDGATDGSGAAASALSPTKSSDLTPLLPQQFNVNQLLERAEPIQQQSIRTNGDLSGFDLNAQTAPRSGATTPTVNSDFQADQTGAQAINSVNQLLSAPGTPPGETSSNGERTGFKLPATPEETASGTLHKEPVEEPGKTLPSSDIQAIVGKEQMHESAGSAARPTGLSADQNKNSPIGDALTAMHSGQYQSAADKLSAIVAKNRSDAQAHYLLAVSYVFLNRVSDASYEYEAAAKYASPGSGLKERVEEGLKRLGTLNNLK